MLLGMSKRLKGEENLAHYQSVIVQQETENVENTKGHSSRSCGTLPFYHGPRYNSGYD